MLSIGSFIYLFILSIILVITFHYGNKKNIKLIKTVAKMLEEVFSPIDKEYIWLGGVVGFSAVYKVKGLK